MLTADMTAGLEEGARLPAPFQLDPGSSHNARLAASMQKLPTSLSQALNGWDTDTKLQVGPDSFKSI